MRSLIQIRRVCLLGVALLTLFFGTMAYSATPAAAASEDKVSGQLEVVGSSLAAMMPGQSGWTALVLQAKNKDLCNIKVTTSTPGTLSVLYPSERGYTAPYRDSTLSSDEIDYIAFRFTVPDSTKAALSVPLTFTWVDCKNDVTSTKTYTAPLPITINTGPAFVQKTLTVGPLKTNTSTWVDVSYTGQSPDLTDFAVKVTNSASTVISYPREASSTKLTNDPKLGVLTTDSVAFRIDTTGIPAGTYVLKTEVSYGSPVTTVPGSLTLTVS